MKTFLSYFLPIHLYLLLIFHVHPAFHFSVEHRYILIGDNRTYREKHRCLLSNSTALPQFFLYICSHLYVHIQVVFLKNINGILAAYLLTTSCHLLFLELFMLFHPYVTSQKPPLPFPAAPVRPAVTAFNYLMFF